MGFIETIIGMLMSIFVDKAWEQMKLEDTADDAEAQLEDIYVDGLDVPDPNDIYGVPYSDENTLREFGALA